MGLIQSMTGFGKSEIINDACRISAEIRSVNHRYLDLAIRAPHRFAPYEGRIRNCVKSYIARGKVEVYITCDDYGMNGQHPVYNSELASWYMGCLNNISSDFNLKNDISAYDLLTLPDVVVMEEANEDERLWDQLEETLKHALDNLLTERRREGTQLRKDLWDKLDRMTSWVDEIENISPSIVDEYQKKLFKRMKDALSSLGATVDESRIVTEAAIFADRISTDEEIVRLKSHMHSAHTKLELGGVCGKELDFIAQEMAREANTILSKSNDLKKSDLAIALKAEIEMLREQVQNIE